MEQHRLSFYFEWSFGLSILYKDSMIAIVIPFVEILIGLNKDAHGIRFFKD